MNVSDLTKSDVIEALRICARREKCTGCKMLLTNAATRRVCFSALQKRAAELLEGSGPPRASAPTKKQQVSM